MGGPGLQLEEWPDLHCHYLPEQSAKPAGRRLRVRRVRLRWPELDPRELTQTRGCVLRCSAQEEQRQTTYQDGIFARSRGKVVISNGKSISSRHSLRQSILMAVARRRRVI